MTENQKAIEVLSQLEKQLNNESVTDVQALINNYIANLSKQEEPEYRQFSGPATVGLYVKWSGSFIKIRSILASGTILLYDDMISSTNIEPVLYKRIEPVKPMEFEGTLAEFDRIRVENPGRWVPATRVRVTQILGTENL